jgi:hypothetical protein
MRKMGLILTYNAIMKGKELAKDSQIRKKVYSNTFLGLSDNNTHQLWRI